MGEGWPGTSRSTLARSRALSRSPSGEPNTPSAASAAAASAGVPAVVKMNERAELRHRSTSSVDPALSRALLLMIATRFSSAGLLSDDAMGFIGSLVQVMKRRHYKPGDPDA